MNKVEMGKEYEDAKGNAIRILCTDRRSLYSVVGMGCAGGLRTYTAVGLWQEGQVHEYDIVEVVPWSKFKVDDRVYVRYNGGEVWRPRYFSRLDCDGAACCWANGATSYSGASEVMYRQCISEEEYLKLNGD